MCVDQGRARRNVSKSANWLNLAQAAGQCFQFASPRVGSRSVAAPCNVNAAMIRELPAGYLVGPLSAWWLPRRTRHRDGIREPKVGSCAVWLRGDRDTASVMQRPRESCFRLLKIADETCDRYV